MKRENKKLLFEIDDDTWWMGELTSLLFTWILIVVVFAFYNFDFSSFMRAMQELIRAKFFVQIIITYILVLSAISIIRILIVWRKNDRKIQFYEDRMVRTYDEAVFELAKIDEGFSLSMMMRGNYVKIKKRAVGYRKYAMFLLFPLSFLIILIGKPASLLVYLIFLLKYRKFSFEKDMFFPYLSLVNNKNEGIVLLISGPNRKRILSYINQYLHIDPVLFPRYNVAIPEKIVNINQQTEGK